MSGTAAKRPGPAGKPGSAGTAPRPPGGKAGPRAPGKGPRRTGNGKGARLRAALQGRPGLPWWRTTKAYLAASLGGLVAAAWVLSYLFPREAYWIYLAATLAALFPFGRRALAVARAGTPFSIETLMCLAALGAVVIGAAEEAAVVVLLFAVGELLENVAAGQA